MSVAPPKSKVKKFLSDKAVGQLYNALPHPPDVYLDPKYAFRQADGSMNNVHEPDLGRSGTAYAKNVQSKKPIHPSALPDPGLVFDTLLKANDRVNHHGGSSSLVFAFASIVTHSLFKTNPINYWKNDASSYFDLSPLYGNNAEEVKNVRDPNKIGRGLLRPDTFSDERLIFLPPACGALLVLFNRNHNYIAEMILKLNEKKRWTDPPPTDPAKLKAQEDELFETARLINCGHFISIIMNDYVAGFLGLGEGNAWSMDPFDPIRYRDGKTVARGQGNHVSVEFNILYHWHTTISAADELWTQNLFSGIQSFQGQSVEKMELKDFVPAIVQEFQKSSQKKPHERTFSGLARGADGKFSTDEIAKILQDATDEPAGQYRARGIPGIMRPIEMLGITQARRWGVCTMNEFRAFLGLKQFDTFEEWNPDPEIAKAARNLYNHIDNLELYTGLVCEQYMPLSPGLRFSCGYTMTRAVLSDAICLIRGDRFFSTCFSPAFMTSWGYQDATTRPENGGFDGHLPKLLTRIFPRNYPFNSIYGIFPFFTPQKMKDTLKRKGLLDRPDKPYSFARPTPGPIPKFIDNFTAIDFVFKNPEKFVSGYNLSGLGGGYGFMIAFDEKEKHDKDKKLAKQATFGTTELFNDYVKWFRETTIKEIKAQSWKAGDSKAYVDIVSVIKTVYTHWAADILCGIPLKTKDNPRAQFTVNEIFDMFADLFTASFLGFGDNERFWSLIQKAGVASAVIQGAVKESVLRVKAASSATNSDASDKANKTNDKLAILKDWVREVEDYVYPPDDKEWFKFISRLDSTNRPVNELVANIVGLANGSSVNQAHSAINVIDFYLDRKEDFEKVKIIMNINDDKHNELTRGFVREAMRLNPQFTGLWRVSKVEEPIPGTDFTVKPGERIWGGFKKAHLDPKVFSKPETVDPARDPNLYQLNGGGFHLCIGVSFAVQVISDTLRIVYNLKNVQRAPGDAGRLVGITKSINAVETNQYIKPDGTITDWPVSMILSYDEE
ncbi:hypothetical protein AX15_004356 [Amanita polypyramis BW_CC]|nr:hypothetical protein AX15_004356 [Amanita polypyramis BW_CC]